MSLAPHGRIHVKYAISDSTLPTPSAFPERPRPSLVRSRLATPTCAQHNAKSNKMA